MRLILSAILCSFAIVGAAQATPLYLTAGPRPDIFVGFATVKGGSGGGGGYLTVSAWTASLDFDGLPPPDYSVSNGSLYSGLLSISATTSGTGSLSVGGKVPALGATSGTLLLGSLAQFGYMDPPSGGEIFEFVFNVTGGDLASFFSPQIGVILDANSSHFTGSFAQGFANDDDGVLDVFRLPQPGVIPEPLTAAGVLFGLISSAGYLRRRLAK
jgi:hypothetical protein